MGVMQCNQCGGAVTMTDDNGVVDPDDGDRIEHYECASCGRTGMVTLLVDGGTRKTGCLA